MLLEKRAGRPDRSRTVADGREGAVGLLQESWADRAEREERMRRIASPSEEVIERGFKASSLIDANDQASGAVLNVDGAVMWRYRTEPKRHMWSFLNLLRKPDFIVCDLQGREVVRIRRTSRVPPRFDIVRQGQIVGQIAARSVLRTRYTVALSTGTTWLFYMPLYTVAYWGLCSTGSKFWVGLDSRRCWRLLFEDDHVGPELLSAMAFIHREQWSYN